jgi:MFS transporter, Spinster family, sphingosine-1-phosphate transporter
MIQARSSNSSIASSAASSTTGAPRVPTAAWVALAVLSLINLFNYIDRYVLPAVGESMKRSGLYTLDSQFGLLASAFLIVYMFAAPVFGGFGDRPWRLRLVAGGVAVWSIATALTGLAQSYGGLLTARASVGIGEASFSAIAPAVIADYFPERLRGRVFAVFYAATPVGAALGYVIGGLIDHRFGWRVAFLATGIPGLLLAALALLVRNPAPGASGGDGRGAESAQVAAQPFEGFHAYLPLLENGPYLRAVLGYAAYTFAIGGISVFMPTFLIRERGLSSATANTSLGGVVVLTGLIGTFVGGWIGDALNKRTPRGNLWLCGVSMLLAAPCAYVALTAPTPTVYWPALVAAELLAFASTSPVNAVIISEVPPAARAAAMAASILAIHALGDGPAPTIIGALSDRFSLARAVLIIPVAIVVSGLIWCDAARRGPARVEPQIW